MAENNSSSVPPQMNLEEILRTLSSLQPIPATQQEEQGPSGVESQTSYNDFLSQSHASTTTQSYPEVYHGDPRLNGRVQPQHRVSTPAKPPPPKASTPVADSSSIIEWKHGLRAVSKNASQNPTFEGTVQKMILDQKRNVRDWEAGRRRLLEEHKSKREIEQSQRAAISIPGLLDNAPLLRTPEREQEELEQYHQKVYRASKHMSLSHSAELKRLAVPFFGTRAELVRADDENASSVLEEDLTPGPDADGKITKSQLTALQRKMLNHLVELYGE